jgi:hypothetical protein
MTDERKSKSGLHEICTIDKNGRVSDAAIHDAIMADVDDEAMTEATRQRVRRRGIPEETIEWLYGKPRSKESK